MKKKQLAFVFIFLTVLPSVRAQLMEQERFITNQYGTNVLLRQWGTSYRIAYAENTIGFFVGKTANTTPANKVALLANAFVHDMDPYGEHLLFCGRFGRSQDSGYVGIMDIPGSIENGQPVNIVPIRKLYFRATGDTFQHFIPSRMVAFADSSNPNGYGYHALMVGACHVTTGNPPVQSYICTTLCEAIYDAGGWQYWMYHNPNDGIAYTDVAATENYVVAVGKNNVSGKLVLKVFERHHDIAIANPVSTYNMTEITEAMETEIGDMIMVEALSGDQFATANYYSDSHQAGVTVKLFDATNGTPVPIVSSHHPQANGAQIPSSWQLQNMDYDTYNQRLYLLQDDPLPVYSSYMHTIQDYNITNFSTAAAFLTWNGNYDLYDVSTWYGMGLLAIGNDGTQLMTYFKKAGVDTHECWTTTYFYCSKTTPESSFLYRPEKISGISTSGQLLELTRPYTVSTENGCAVFNTPQNDDNESEQ